MAKTTPMEFIRQVRTEMKKVTWPSKQETTASAISVLVMVVIASVFLYFADQFMAFIVRFIMGFGL